MSPLGAIRAEIPSEVMLTASYPPVNVGPKVENLIPHQIAAGDDSRRRQAMKHILALTILAVPMGLLQAQEPSLKARELFYTPPPDVAKPHGSA